MSSKQTVPAVQQQRQQYSEVLEKLRQSLTAVLLSVAELCLAKMHFLLPTASVGDVWDEEKVTVPQKGKCTAISRSFQ